MNTNLSDRDFERFKDRFREYLISELEINGEPMVRELIYRFAMVQFRDTRDFEPGRIHFIPKILSEMQKEFGILFEEFASFCFDRDLDSGFVNGTVKEWLKEIISEILPQDRT
ncbi:MAG TPA: hypothetical protein PKG52_06320 [bacterium]|nr:hypothetical protein [bacterium]HPS30015.1 hypothetical protein [bacterium]